MSLHLSGTEKFVEPIKKLIKESRQSLGWFKWTAMVSAELREGTGEFIEMDSVDGTYEQSLLKHLTNLSPEKAVLIRRGTNRNEFHVVLTFQERHVDAVGRSLVRATYEHR